MAKIKGKVLAVKENLAKIQVEKPSLKVGDRIEVKFGKTRSLKANAFYWCYLSFVCKDCDLWNDHAHCPESLHDSLKRHFLSEKTYDDGKFKIFFTGSTTELTQKEMYEYIEKIDLFVQEIFKINTKKFWSDYAQNFSRG